MMVVPVHGRSGRENMSDVELVNPNITQNPLNQAEISETAAETTSFLAGCGSEREE